MRLNAIFAIVDPLQFCVYCTKSRVPLCIHFVVHCLYLLCQYGLHVVPWMLIGILMHLLAAESLSTAGLLHLTHYHYGTILHGDRELEFDGQCRLSFIIIIIYDEIII